METAAKGMTMTTESYKHKFAKDTLVDWLRNTVQQDKDKDSVSLDPIYARTNRGPPLFGVFTEYPVCIDCTNKVRGLCPVWDESEWNNDVQRPPTYDECLGMGLLPFVIFDIGILHKGSLYVAIEIVHRNHIDQQKRDKLARIWKEDSGWLELYTIRADWILNQWQQPKTLYFEQRLTCPSMSRTPSADYS
jgi:hypothetical protein